MPPSKWPSLWSTLERDAAAPSFHSFNTSVHLSEMLHGSVLGRPQPAELAGRSVLLLVADQLKAALALVELDGVAARIVLCPPALDPGHLPTVIRDAGVDAIVCDGDSPPGLPPVSSVIHASSLPTPTRRQRPPERATEWVLLTSGTTGAPKLVAHTLASLAGSLMHAPPPDPPVVWSTFYDIRRYGGLQIFLRALFLRTPLVLSDASETPDAFLARAGQLGVTHISGTPSHWRRALMGPAAGLIDPEYVRLSGEIADQAILNQLQATYPRARVAHAFASTEAGLVFEVNDSLAGFPADLLVHTPGIELRIVDDTLRVRSDRTASRYLGDNAPPLREADGYVDTRDLLELQDGRYNFVGRGDGVINVGGQKVHPEEVEAVLNRHPDVHMSLVWPKKSPITGALVVADIVLRTTPATRTADDTADPRAEILRFCRAALPAYKVPVLLNVVSSLAVSASGKLARSHA